MDLYVLLLGIFTMHPSVHCCTYFQYSLIWYHFYSQRMANQQMLYPKRPSSVWCVKKLWVKHVLRRFEEHGVKFALCSSVTSALFAKYMYFSLINITWVRNGIRRTRPSRMRANKLTYSRRWWLRLRWRMVCTSLWLMECTETKQLNVHWQNPTQITLQCVCYQGHWQLITFKDGNRADKYPSKKEFVKALKKALAVGTNDDCHMLDKMSFIKIKYITNQKKATYCTHHARGSLLVV